MRVTKGCPICENDVLGERETGYYCKRCNLLFSRRHIVYRHVREETRAAIKNHFPAHEASSVTPYPVVKPFPQLLSLERTLVKIRAARASLEATTRSLAGRIDPEGGPDAWLSGEKAEPVLKPKRSPRPVKRRARTKNEKRRAPAAKGKSAAQTPRKSQTMSRKRRATPEKKTERTPVGARKK